MRLSKALRSFCASLSTVLLVVVLFMCKDCSDNQQLFARSKVGIRAPYQAQHVPHMPQQNKKEGKFRCQVRDFGCISFQSDKDIFNKSEALLAKKISTQECLLLCFKRHYKLTATVDEKCYCTNLLIPIKVDIVSCEETVPYKYSVLHLFEKGSSCTENPENISESTIGCFPRPTNIEEVTLKKMMSFKMTRALCIVECEKGKFTLAIVPRHGVCICTSFDKLSIDSTKQIMMQSVHPRFLETYSCRSSTEMVVWRTLVEDSCGSKRFLNQEFPLKVGLVSHPGSGNTWVRHLLEGSTGLYTGSWYIDEDLFSKGFFGEGESAMEATTLTVKFHPQFQRKNVDFFTLFPKYILLLRNPYESFVAEFNRWSSGEDHTGVAPVQDFSSKKWFRFVETSRKIWIKNYTNLVERNNSKLIVLFDDLQLDPITEVRKMLKFIGVQPLDLENRLACLKRNLVGNFKRNKKGSLDPFDDNLKRDINNIIQILRVRMKRKNLCRLPDWERPLSN
ncbi:sialate:O-sulfotransferase 1-like [Ciona intestinalis]